MGLTIGDAPFGTGDTGSFNFSRTGPPHALYLHRTHRRVRGVFAGQTVVDSTNAKLLHETGSLPVYYFPLEDVRMDLLQATDHSTHCPFKGDANYRSIVVEGRESQDAAWEYRRPIDGCPPIEGHVAFYWHRMDAWFEEDEEVFVHPRDPFHRIDALASSRHVIVSLEGHVLAESRRPTVLFETGLPPRFYVPREDVVAEALRPSEARTRCPYKGTASYHGVQLGDTVHEDFVWYYPDPIPEAAKIEGLLSFYNEKVDLIVDGEAWDRAVTKFS